MVKRESIKLILTRVLADLCLSACSEEMADFFMDTEDLAQVVEEVAGKKVVEVVEDKEEELGYMKLAANSSSSQYPI